MVIITLILFSCDRPEPLNPAAHGVSRLGETSHGKGEAVARNKSEPNSDPAVQKVSIGVPNPFGVPKTPKCVEPPEQVWLRLEHGMSPEVVKHHLHSTNQWQEHRAAYYQWWGAISPENALQDAKSANPGGSTFAVGSVLSGWLRKDTPACLAWLDSQPNGAEKGIWAQALIHTLEPSAVGDFANWAESLAAATSNHRVLTTAADRWRSAAPEQALAWLQSLAERQAVPENAVVAFVRDWSLSDPRQVSEYLQAQPLGEHRDRMVGAFVQTLKREDVASAQVWAGTIQDDSLRESLFPTQK